MHTPQALARSALQATGSNPDRHPRPGDTAAAVRYIVDAVEAEWGETYTGNVNTLIALSSLRALAERELEEE